MTSDIDKDSDDKALPATENLNYNLADKESCTLEAFKRSKYRPTFVKQDRKVLMGTYEGSVKEIFVGPATKHGKDLHWVRICLITLISKDGCVWFVSLETTKIGSQPCGFLCNVKHLVEWGRWDVSIFLVSLDIFLPHDEQGLESEITRGLQCYQAF